MRKAIVTAGVWALAVSHGRQKSWLAWSLLTLVAVNLPVYQHATSAYARYLVPEMLPLLALALGAHLQWQRTTAKHGLRIGTALVAALLLAGAGISLVGDMRYARSSDGMEEAFALRGKIAAENWYLPDDVLSLHKGMLNAAYLDGAWTRALQLEKSNDGLREWLTTHGLPLDSADVLERNFSEYEQSQAVHIRLLRHYALPGGGTQVVFGARNLPDAALGRNALLSLSYNDAQRSYLEKSSAAMLDRCQLHAEVPLLHANEWCWYQH